MNYQEFPLNCWLEGHTPDYSKYSNLEINGVLTFKQNNEEYCEAVFSIEEVPSDKRGLYFTIYGRFKTGHIEALHDVSSIKIAKHIATKISEQNPCLGDVQVFWE